MMSDGGFALADSTRAFRWPQAERLCYRASMMPARLPVLTLLFVLMATIPVSVPEGAAQPAEDAVATTELSCAFAMPKGEAGQECRVPFPQGCLVAHIPGTQKPWTTLSKGGRLMCRFDEKRTDWKTTITGVCGRCRSDHCSAQFSVRFDCSHQQ